MSDLQRHELAAYHEIWREYDFSGRVYRIVRPQTLWMREGGSTHRVVDGDGIVHLVPAPGVSGCVVRWKKEDGYAPVDF